MNPLLWFLLLALPMLSVSPMQAQAPPSAGDTVRIVVRRGVDTVLAPRVDTVVTPRVVTLQDTTLRARTDTLLRPRLDTVTGVLLGPAAVVRPIPTPTPTPTPSQLGDPELPRDTVDVTMPAVTGRTITVAATGDGAALQAALDSAQPGDAVVLPAGATYRGAFVLRNKLGAGWITVRTAGTLPPPGTRVTPADAAQMPKLLATSTEPVLATEDGARHWRLVGLELGAVPSLTYGYMLVHLGSATATTTAQLAHHLVLDRVYLHGHDSLDVGRCLALNSGATAIVDSWVSACHGKGRDSQAILGWNGTGPYRIENNYLEGATENVMFGGADPRIPGVVPAVITIRRNHFFKPRAWETGPWVVKNSFELKAGQRVLVEGNVFENSFGWAQNGTLIVLKTVDQEGTAPWTATSDVTFSYNVLKGGWNGIALSGLPNPELGGIRMRRLLFEHNLVTELGERGGYPGLKYPVAVRIGSVPDVTFRRNTLYGGGGSFLFEGTGTDRLVITDNILGNILGSQEGKGWWGDGADAYHAPGMVLARNLIVADAYTWPKFYPTLNVFAASPDSVGFVDPATGDWRLPTGSPYRAYGADVDAVLRRTAGVVVPAASRGTP